MPVAASAARGAGDIDDCIEPIGADRELDHERPGLDREWFCDAVKLRSAAAIRHPPTCSRVSAASTGTADALAAVRGHVMDNDLPTVARRRVQARMGFFIHAMMYVVMNAGLIAIWYATGATYPWFIWPLLGWGIALLAHSITLFLGPGSRYETRAIQRELHRLRTLPH